MFGATKRGTSWFGWGNKPKNVHSLDQLKYLYNVMSRNQTVTEQNKTLLVETLRSIAEILIWGDQNDSSVFDFFLEKNMLSFFLRIMKQKCGSYVCVQLLQTLNILFENIRHETSLYYLLSNNHVNSIIVHKFDFSDEEVMAYYISFLKTLSLKLNTHTIHFFFNEHTNDFPLYTEAIKFFNHPEKMVRIAVRTLTLNVFRVEEKSMLRFITDKTAVPYFSNLVWFIGNHVLEIDSCLHGPEKTAQMVLKLDDLVAEHLDHLHYINDILLLDDPDLNAILTDHLLNRLLIPLYIFSLIDDSIQASNLSMKSISQASPSNSSCNSSASASSTPRRKISRIVSLFLLSQVFLIISFEKLVCQLLSILKYGSFSLFAKPQFSAPLETLEESLVQASKNGSIGSSHNCCCDNESCASSSLYKSSSIVNDDETMTNNNDGQDDQCQHSRRRRQQEEEEEEKMEDDQVAQTVDQMSQDCNESFNATTINEASITDEEKAAAAAFVQNRKTSITCDLSAISEERLFLRALFDCLDPSHSKDDHMFIFALCLIYAIVHNKGLREEELGDLLLVNSLKERDILANPCPEVKEESCCNNLIKCLTQILHMSCQYNSRIRLVTLEMSIMLLKKLSMREGKSILPDQQLASIEQAREESALILRNFFKTEDETIFLDIFEEEFCEMKKRKLNVEYLMMDANLLLPPNQLTSLMMNGIDLTRRLPCAEDERTRYAVRVFFLIRDLSLVLRGEEEKQLPLTKETAFVKVDQLLDLNNSDLIACTVITKEANGSNNKMRRFMVIDAQQLILIEPDNRKLGFGVAKFVAMIQDVEVNPDKDDTRSLHLVIRERTAPSKPKKILLSAKFVFDDHIRCLAAKQRLTKGRTKVRQKKMHAIAKLIELGTYMYKVKSHHSTHLQTKDMTRSHSQEGFNRKHGNRRSPSTFNGHHHSPNASLSIESRRGTRSPSTSRPVRREAKAREASCPRPTTANELTPGSYEKNEKEMIPLEDLSPKSSRRKAQMKLEIASQPDEPLHDEQI